MVQGSLYFRLYKHTGRDVSGISGRALVGEGADIERKDDVKKVHKELYHEKGIGLWAIIDHEVFPFFWMRTEVA